MLVIVFMPQKLVVHAADSDSIVNERIPVTAKQLELHWKVDCELTLSETLTYLQNANYHRQTEQKLSANLKKCEHIYNTVDSVHYKPLPDYRSLSGKLSNLHE